MPTRTCNRIFNITNRPALALKRIGCLGPDSIENMISRMRTKRFLVVFNKNSCLERSKLKNYFQKTEKFVWYTMPRIFGELKSGAFPSPSIPSDGHSIPGQKHHVCHKLSPSKSKHPKTAKYHSFTISQPLLKAKYIPMVTTRTKPYHHWWFPKLSTHQPTATSVDKATNNRHLNTPRIPNPLLNHDPIATPSNIHSLKASPDLKPEPPRHHPTHTFKIPSSPYCVQFMTQTTNTRSPLPYRKPPTNPQSSKT